MEPLTTISFIAYCAVGAAVTSRNILEAPRIEEKSPTPNMIIKSRPAPSNILVANAMPLKALPFLTLKDKIITELETFTPGHPGGDPGIVSKTDDIATAKEFIQVLPAGIPLPTLMRTDDGQIGMYWDIDDVYVDINIDPGRTISVFSRIRSQGKDSILDAVPIQAVTPLWALENMAVLADSHALAA